MAASIEFYEQVVSTFPDTESLTVVVASGVTRDAVLASLGADLSSPAEDAWDTDERSTAWAAVEVPGGVIAVELSGYGDPSLTDLAWLSKAGAAAVVRGNIQAHYRFGCARTGELIFDDDEFIFLRDPDRVPAELRPMFDAAWEDIEEDGTDNKRADPFAAGLAMAELVTGVELTVDHVASVLESEFFQAPSLCYPPVEDATAPALVIPEGEAGLAAAARIGRDVEGDPGARVLSGELGSVVAVERTIRGTRRKLFRDCAYLDSWSHLWTPEPGSHLPSSWIWGGAWVNYELDKDIWCYSVDHPDQLTGRNGAIRSSFVEVDKPARAVRRWNWMQPRGANGNATRDNNPVLAADSIMTVSLTQSQRDGEPWTTIRIEHAGLPVEWLDDMETYWAYQLTIADHAGFGVAP
ncbi:MAG: hypothetical protein J2P22_00415 [Nocardioides sp.]|nr:hypothetical protein [Nocardioides sp.]